MPLGNYYINVRESLFVFLCWYTLFFYILLACLSMGY